MEGKDNIESSFSRIKLKKLFHFSQYFFMIFLLFCFSFGNALNGLAAVLNIEILSNITTTNNSLTTPINRYSPIISNQPVTFTITGEALANVSANLIGTKYAALVIPIELANKVQPVNPASISTDVIIDLTEVAVLDATLAAINDLTTLLTQISSGALGDLTGVTFNTTQIYQQLNLLNNLENTGHADFTQSMALSPDGRLIYINLDSGLGPILADDLKTILADLSMAVTNLEATGTGIVGTATAIAINTALNLLKPTLTGAISVVMPLLTGTGIGIQQLADASVIGDTSIQMPTTVSGPGAILTLLDAKFVGTVVKTDLLDINLLSTADGSSYIYFSSQQFSLNSSLLPANLHFGTHAIQTKLDETFNATENGEDNASLTTAIVEITDTRTEEKNWGVKVSQNNNWSNGSETLADAIVTINGGTLSSSGIPLSAITSISNSSVSLTSGDQQNVVLVSGTAMTGTVSLNLSSFTLFVPKNSQKKPVNYETVLVWTLSDGPP